MPRLTELVAARRQLDLLGDMQAYLMIEAYGRSGELHSSVTCATYLSPWAHQTFSSAEFPRSYRKGSSQDISPIPTFPLYPPLPTPFLLITWR